MSIDDDGDSMVASQYDDLFYQGKSNCAIRMYALGMPPSVAGVIKMSQVSFSESVTHKSCRCNCIAPCKRRFMYSYFC